jgi:threonine synthase
MSRGMTFRSTRGQVPGASVSEAITTGLAPDGGLYVPAVMPRLDCESFAGATSLIEVGERLLAPFFAADPLAERLPEILQEALDFPAPCVPLGDPGRASVLELYHGPTCAFKDFGARFLAACLTRVPVSDPRPLTILVATSGDTGGAVAAALHERPGFEAVVLYPRGLVSGRQAHQLACWGDNVRTFAVNGTFDDCQRLVKAAFQDDALRANRRLSSANSINLGRVLPQMVYYAATSLGYWREHRIRPAFIVPSGNLGNVLACIWSRAIGLPIGDIVLATNANRTVTDYLDSGEWRPRASVSTLASAMDVGDPSNMERLMAFYPAIREMREAIAAYSVSDAEIRQTIARDAADLGRVWCPHSATAAHVHRRLASDRAQMQSILVATAHPAKFDEIVEPLIGHAIPVPDELARLLARPRHELQLEPALPALRSALETGS